MDIALTYTRYDVKPAPFIICGCDLGFDVVEVAVCGESYLDMPWHGDRKSPPKVSRARCRKCGWEACAESCSQPFPRDDMEFHARWCPGEKPKGRISLRGGGGMMFAPCDDEPTVIPPGVHHE